MHCGEPSTGANFTATHTELIACREPAHSRGPRSFARKNSQPGLAFVNERYRTAAQFWSAKGASKGHASGMAAFGGSGASEFRYRHWDEARTFRRIVPLSSEMRILELGCGNGRWIGELAPSVRRYVAVDLSGPMLEKARQLATERKLSNVDLVEADARTYLPDGAFDIIYLAGVSQFFDDDDLAERLRTLRPSLAPDGVIVDRSTVYLHARGYPENPDYWCVYRTPAELTALADACGYSCTGRFPSYRPLNFTLLIRRILRRRIVQLVVDGTAPASYHLLHRAAMFDAKWFGPRGSLLRLSHDFFVFRPTPS